MPLASLASTMAGWTSATAEKGVLAWAVRETIWEHDRLLSAASFRMGRG